MKPPGRNPILDIRSTTTILLLLACLPLPAWGQSDEDEIPAPKAEVALMHQSATVRLYEPDERPPRAVFVFGSGDGGWSAWEDAASHWLRDAGVYVIGFDLRSYAQKDFDSEKLGRDMATLANEGVIRSGGDANTPIIYGGWSMGAVQAVPAGAFAGRPPSLKGLVLMSADSRGRYGLRASDELGITPPGRAPLPFLISAKMWPGCESRSSTVARISWPRRRGFKGSPRRISSTSCGAQTMDSMDRPTALRPSCSGA